MLFFISGKYVNHWWLQKIFVNIWFVPYVIVVLIGIIYIISRSLGKYFGAYISSKATKCSPNIVKYLGITLLPQAGVALGMALKANELGNDGSIVRNITLFAVLIYEIVGPFLTKIALTKSGDIKSEERVSARNEKLA
mgnify:CR=1 FL=1